MSTNTLYVLDTNVILHDAQSIFSYGQSDIAIPITVLEELDQFKKGSNDINFQARFFLRTLDELAGDLLSNEGAMLGEGRGRIRVVLESGLDARIAKELIHDNPDHRIISTALNLMQTESNREVILVSKDTNVRLKGKAFGIKCRDYQSDKLESIDKLYTGKRTLEVSQSTIDRFYGDGDSVPADDLAEVPSPIANENFILKSGSKSVLAVYNADAQSFLRTDKLACYGINPRNAEQTFALQALTDDSIRLVTLAGKAGSGKTLLALAAALQSRSQYRQIMLARPVVPLSNKDLGFLPGDIEAKLTPYMQPLHDNLNVIKHQFESTSGEAQRIEKMMELEKIIITPLAYIRGRTLQRMFFIVDEAQNLTPHEVKTIITRAGEGTKIVFTGDIHQIDHPYLDSLSNGLSYLINRMVGQSIFAHVTLQKGERSELADIASRLL